MIPKTLRHKIFNHLNDLTVSLELMRQDNKSVVFTNGCFDLIHPGHIHSLLEAKALGDFLIVGLNTDNSIRRIKGDKRPVKDQMSRAVVLATLQPVDAVVLFNEDTPIKLIEFVKPDVLVKGAEYDNSQIDGAEFVRSYGGDVVRIPMLTGYSTTAILKSLS